MIYITGDTHGSFKRVGEICERFGTSKEDILIILGDAGVNFSGAERDKKKKEYLSSLPVTLFCIHGNHEQRPETIPTYEKKVWHQGEVYYEPQYPDLLFAKDGEVYDLDGKSVVAIGGAYSMDKRTRLMFGFGWWEDEQPSAETKRYVERQLERRDWNVDAVLSHTTPLKYQPTEIFAPGFDHSRVDESTERWLDEIEERLNYRKWYCGHFHIEKKIDRLEIMFENCHAFGVE